MQTRGLPGGVRNKKSNTCADEEPKLGYSLMGICCCTAEDSKRIEVSTYINEVFDIWNVPDEVFDIWNVPDDSLKLTAIWVIVLKKNGYIKKWHSKKWHLFMKMENFS
jgi:hypothetical protein